MKSLKKNIIQLLCLVTILAVALPADAKPKKHKGWKAGDAILQSQIDAIELTPG